MLSLSLAKLLVLNFRMTDICATPCFFPSTAGGCQLHPHTTDTFITSCSRKKRKESLPSPDDASKKVKQMDDADSVVYYDACECLDADQPTQENLADLCCNLEFEDAPLEEVDVPERPGLLQSLLSRMAGNGRSSPDPNSTSSAAEACTEHAAVTSTVACSQQEEHAQHKQPPAAATYITQTTQHSHQAEEDEDEYAYFDPLLFMKNLPPLEHCISLNRPTLLPKRTRRCKQKTLVLDLDETLVHSSMQPIPSPDFSFVVEFNNQHHSVHVKRRPHLDAFLQRAAELFEVVVFTASQKVYAEKLLNLMDPQRQLVRHRVFRDSCVLVDGNYLKDLTVLGRDMRHTFIVDNSPQAFGFQVDNGIPIESWYDDEHDTELLSLLPFLEQLARVEDVRPHIQQKFRMKELITRC